MGITILEGDMVVVVMEGEEVRLVEDIQLLKLPPVDLFHLLQSEVMKHLLVVILSIVATLHQPKVEAMEVVSEVDQ